MHVFALTVDLSLQSFACGLLILSLLPQKYMANGYLREEALILVHISRVSACLADIAGT